MRKMHFDRIFSTVNILFLIVICIITILPLYYLCVISITDPVEYLKMSGKLLFPTKLSFGAYKVVLTAHSFRSSTLVSTFLATVGTTLSLAVTASFAYGISKKRLVGRKILLLIVLFTILFQPGIIPNYLVVRGFKLIDSLWSLILPVLTSGFYIILMRSFFENIPPEMEEAAVIEGCNDLQIFIRIIIPLSYASLAAFGLFYAVNYWNSYFNAVLYINDPEKWPLQIFIRNLVILSTTSDISEKNEALKSVPAESIKMATVIVGTLPIVCVYPFLQKHFAKGVMLGSIKG